MVSPEKPGSQWTKNVLCMEVASLQSMRLSLCQNCVPDLSLPVANGCESEGGVALSPVNDAKMKAVGTAATNRTPYSAQKKPNQPRIQRESLPRTAAMQHEATPINRKIAPRAMMTNSVRGVSMNMAGKTGLELATSAVTALREMVLQQLTTTRGLPNAA